MSSKTRAEYEAIKAVWRTLGGVLEDDVNAHGVESDRRPYRYLTLTRSVPRDLATVLSTLMQFGTLAVRDGAYLSVVTHEDEVQVRAAVDTHDMEGVLLTPCMTDTETPFATSAMTDTGDSGVTPAERGSLLDDHDCPCGQPDGHPHAHDKQGG